LQESIAGNQYDVVAFARQRQLWVYYAQVRQSDRGPSGNAILTTEQPLNVSTIILPRIHRMRKAVVASFEIEGQSMFVVNAHLENRLSWLKGGLFADTARGKQTQALLNALPPGPGIVGGDLNTILGVDEPTVRLLTERFGDTPTERSVPTFHDRLVLDHLFFDLPDGWIGTRQVIANRYNSDHHPRPANQLGEGRRPAKCRRHVVAEEGAGQGTADGREQAAETEGEEEPEHVANRRAALTDRLELVADLGRHVLGNLQELRHQPLLHRPDQRIDDHRRNQPDDRADHAGGQADQCPTAGRGVAPEALLIQIRGERPAAEDPQAAAVAEADEWQRREDPGEEPAEQRGLEHRW